jgi:deoxyribodipyrimidine photo-lyase
MLQSKTGFLIIDAALNELKITGFMHNRARLIVATFWTKYLLINPFHIKYGSQTGFSKLLVDAIGST